MGNHVTMYDVDELAQETEEAYSSGEELSQLRSAIPNGSASSGSNTLQSVPSMLTASGIPDISSTDQSALKQQQRAAALPGVGDAPQPQAGHPHGSPSSSGRLPQEPQAVAAGSPQKERWMKQHRLAEAAGQPRTAAAALAVGSISPAADGSIHWALPPASLDWLLPHGQGPAATGQGPDLAKASPCTGLESGQLPGCKLVQSPVFCLPGHVAVQGLCKWRLLLEPCSKAGGLAHSDQQPLGLSLGLESLEEVEGSGLSEALVLEAHVSVVPLAGGGGPSAGGTTPAGGAAGAGAGGAAGGAEAASAAGSAAGAAALAGLSALSARATSQHTFTARQPVALLPMTLPASAAADAATLSSATTTTTDTNASANTASTATEQPDTASTASTAASGKAPAAQLRLQVVLKASPASPSSSAAATTAASTNSATTLLDRGAGHSAGPSAATTAALVNTTFAGTCDQVAAKAGTCADVDAAPASSAAAAASKAGKVAEAVGSSFAAISRLVLGSGAQDAGLAKGKAVAVDIAKGSETTDAAAEKDQGVVVQPAASGTAAAAAAAGGEDVGAVRDVLRSDQGLPLKVQVVSESPRVIIIDNFLPGPLCQQVMDLAGPRLIRSRVASGSETPSRTSWSTFFTGDSAKHPLVLEVEARISALMASEAVVVGRRSLANVEALQVVRYHEGEFYAEHYDNKAGSNITRAATIIVYLCDTQQGGATYFSRSTGLPPSDAAIEGVAEGSGLEPPGVPPAPLTPVSAPRPGLRVLPRQGRALVFWSRLPDGGEDFASIHAAQVVEGGEKWIATRWFKEVEE